MAQRKERTEMGNHEQEERREKLPDLMLAKQQLEEKDLKIREFEELAKRAQAESENIRKRMEREKRDMIRYSNKQLLIHFLDVIDDFERALKTKPEDGGGQFYSGVEMIYKRLITFLESYGVRPLQANGALFDPNIHEALGVEEDAKYSDEVVIEEYQKGYQMYDELLRSAKVKIGKPPVVRTEEATDSGDEAAESTGFTERDASTGDTE